MKKLLVGVMLVAFSVALGMTAMSKGSGTATLNFDKAGKSATIDYSKHKAKGVKCNDCHIQHKDGKRHMKACGTCHNTKALAMKAGHKLCQTCHKAKGGPTACGGCHK